MGSALASLDEPETGIGTSLGSDYLALRQLLDRLEVVGLRWLAALDGAGVAAADGSASTAAWVRRTTACSARSAAADVRLARRLHTDDLRPLTTTADLLESGRLTVDHARVLARATASLDPAVHNDVEPLIAEAATTLEVDAAGQVAVAVCEHAAELHATEQDDPVAARQAAAEARRHLHLSRCGEHYALDGLLTLEAGAALRAVLDPLSAPRPETGGVRDLRSAPQRRADALGEAARRLLAVGELPIHGGQRPQLTVLVDVSRGSDRGLGSGRLADGGPLSTAATERLACDATVDWVATSSSAAAGGHELVRQALRKLSPAVGGIPSQVLDAGRSQRLVTAAQRRALTHRDRGCVFPGCDCPPDWCDAHHLVHWSRGGPTDLQNLALLCPYHHTTVHDGGWSLIRAADGGVTAHPPP
jgi:hypothetical protein